MILSFPRRVLISSVIFLGAMVLFGSAITAAEESGAQSPQRIVSVNFCTDELLLSLVGPERIAAITQFDRDPEAEELLAKAGEIKKVAGSVEAVLSCNPDLLLAGRFSRQTTVRYFERSGIPVLVFGVPKSFKDIYTDIRKLAQAVGENEKGERIIKEMQDELAALDPKKPVLDPGACPSCQKKKEFVPKRAVFLQSESFVPGRGTFENSIMEAAGLLNVAAQIGIQDYGKLDLEKLIELEPEVLIFTSDQKSGRTIRGEVLSHPAIRNALSQAKVVTVPSSLLNCGSPASVEAVRILVKETSK